MNSLQVPISNDEVTQARDNNRTVERCRTELAANGQSIACGCLETLSQVILVNHMQSLLV